ncbi:MAG: ATP-dependent DNA ligase [Phycisphaera sp.]|nr:ATP-dependent DNA ligase [Phycisphaera sp.]
MRRFTGLVMDLAATRSTRRKIDLLRSYLDVAPPEDVGHALRVLLGRRGRRRIATRTLRRWAGEVAGIPEWMVAACHEQAGDLAETLALVIPTGSVAAAPDDEPSLDEVVRRFVDAPEMQSEASARARMVEAWSKLDADQRFVLHKILGGAFRIGVARGIVVQALAATAKVDDPIIAQRLAGDPPLDRAGVGRLLAPEGEAATDGTRPFPLALATPLEIILPDGDHERPDRVAERLGPVGDWIIEPKWDGMRGQLVRREGITVLWSRHDEPVGRSFPEIVAAGGTLPSDAVIDGEILAVDGDRPLPFSVLQRRIGKTSVEPLLFGGTPIAFVAFDLLEESGQDLRSLPLRERRNRLEQLLEPLESTGAIRLGQVVDADDWTEAAAIRASSRDDRVEGLVIKRAASDYQGGRIRGDWWKWKVAPYSIDLVMTAATLGHGRRASLHSDYTLAAWSRPSGETPRELVTVARAYSGLTDPEVESLDRWIRGATLERHGPVRMVRPERVLELRFDGVQRSGRHRGGLSLRFPRIARLRLDKIADDADDLGMIEALLPEEDRQDWKDRP